jgi:hypothetical protein
VDPAITIAAAGPTQNLCNITTATLGANAAVGAEIGTWTNQSGSGSASSINSPSSGVTGLTIGFTTVLRWTISSGFGGCASTFSDVTLTSDSTTTIAAAGPTQNLCGVTTTTLAANSVKVSETGTWTTFSGSGSASSVNSPTSAVTGLTIGFPSVFRWTITSQFGGCGSTFSDVTINVDSSGTVAVAGPDQNLCNIITATLAANSPTGTDSGGWAVLSGTAIVTDLNDPTSGVTGLSIGDTSVLRWTITTQSGGCAVTTSDVTITSDSLTTSSVAGPDQDLCNITTATLAANTPRPTETGTWALVSGAALITSSNSPTSGITGLAIGSSATLRWSITTANGGCVASTNDVIIDVEVWSVCNYKI